MFRNETVFVLGAGGSWHYGYPTGEALVENVISLASRLSTYCNWRSGSDAALRFIPNYISEGIDNSLGLRGAIEGWQKVQAECDQLIQRLKTVRPLVIDYFLGWNASLRPIGQLAVAAAILECEARWLSYRANQNRRSDATKSPDDWYRFVVHKLVYGCQESADLLKNNVRFVTFNYDTSLEFHLHQALTTIDLLDQVDVGKFLTERIVHIYGSVQAGIPTVSDAIDLEKIKFGQPDDDLEATKTLLDRCQLAAKNLRTIDPHDKDIDEESLRLARGWIEHSNVVYILGYGFDMNNNRRIGLDPHLLVSSNSQKAVMFTNYGNANTINKTASKLFLGSYDYFVSNSVHGQPLGGNYVEKSERTVYEALAKDFYPLEDEFNAGTKF